MWASAPEVCFSSFSPEIRPFSAACLAPAKVTGRHCGVCADPPRDRRFNSGLLVTRPEPRDHPMQQPIRASASECETICISGCNGVYRERSFKSGGPPLGCLCPMNARRSNKLGKFLLASGTQLGHTSSQMPSEFLPFRPEPLNLLMKVRRHFTQNVLAEKLDVNRKTISRWESRQIPLPLYIEPALREILRGICDNQSPATSFTFIDLFAGIGGIRKGFESAGGRAVFTSEWNPWAQQTYGANFGDEGQLVGDIVGFPTEEIPDHDLLLAGFPSQPFSIAGVSKKNSLGRSHGFG